MKRVKPAPKTVVFKNSRENITFAFGIGRHWGLNAGIEYWEAWDWHHFVTGFTIIKFFVTFKINWLVKATTETKPIIACTTTKEQ